MKPIVIINGASSSGRTTLVHEFCSLATGFFPAHVDEFVGKLPSEVWRRCASSDEGWAEIGTLFNEHLIALAKKHRKIIADAFHKVPDARDHLFSRLGRDRVFYVQLYCELRELERREAARGDRRSGLARSQFDSVYSFTGYDLRIDSTRSSANACARTLMDALSMRREPRP